MLVLMLAGTSTSMSCDCSFDYAFDKPAVPRVHREITKLLLNLYL